MQFRLSERKRNKRGYYQETLCSAPGRRSDPQSNGWLLRSLPAASFFTGWHNLRESDPDFVATTPTHLAIRDSVLRWNVELNEFENFDRLVKLKPCPLIRNVANNAAQMITGEINTAA
jgi:hypothetical protein